MDWSAACAAVIPCLNEEAAIGPLVQAVRQHLPTVVVVDDGSIDQTANRATAAGAVVLRHEAPKGKGAALLSGWSEAQRRDFGWSLCLDGDAQHSPDDIPKFLLCAEQTSAALVIGNRMGQSSHIPLVRRWVNRAMSWQLSRLTGQALPDSQCGFRLMNLAEWSRLPLAATHFEVESEVLFQFARAGLRIEFVPIQVIYKEERSKIHPVRDTLRWFRWRRQALPSARASQNHKS
jgi:glycosyltransferase involved in cell wall biosynthesis